MTVVRLVFGHGMRRVLQYALVLAVAVSVNFTLPRMAPGDPLDYMLGEHASQLDHEQRQRILAQFGLDRPVGEQFRTYVADLARGDLGTSVRFGQPVREVIGDRLPFTFALAGASIVLSTLIGTALGVRAAWKRGKGADIGSLVAVMFLDSTPLFWLGMILIGVFSVQLGWLPVFGAIPLGSETGVTFGFEVFRRTIMPVATLTLGTLGTIFLVARYAMVSTLKEDYVLMAEASGLREGRILMGHALRNSLLPIATVVMLNVGFLLGGVVVVETVFSYPGVGRLMFEGVIARDYPLLQGTFLFLAAVVMAANLVADLLYPLLDPRVRRPVAAV